jgi:hypothetical protein
MLFVQARGKEVKMHLYEDNHPLGKKQKMFFFSFFGFRPVFEA